MNIIETRAILISSKQTEMLIIDRKDYWPKAAQIDVPKEPCMQTYFLNK